MLLAIFTIRQQSRLLYLAVVNSCMRHFVLICVLISWGWFSLQQGSIVLQTESISATSNMEHCDSEEQHCPKQNKKPLCCTEEGCARNNSNAQWGIWLQQWQADDNELNYAVFSTTTTLQGRYLAWSPNPNIDVATPPPDC